MKRTPLWNWIILALCSTLLTACGGDTGGTGTLHLSLTDATIPGFQAIYVTVDRVEVHPGEDNGNGSGWITIGAPQQTVNLLELVNGERMELGIASLPAREYTQLRLILANRPAAGLNLLNQPHPAANYFIDDAGNVVELKVPSGLQSGIKLVKGFTVSENGTTKLLLDFDASRSVVRAGSSGQWLLKPTIKVLDDAEQTIVNGTVRDGATGVAGIMVSAQSVDPLASDERNRVIVAAATVTDANGNYQLFLPPGSYNLVAFRSDATGAFGPVCTPLATLPASVQTADFTPAFTSLIGTIVGTVSMTGVPAEQHATLSFRQELPCGATPQPVELQTLNVAAGGSYDISLPPATYQAVAWSLDRPTRAVDAAIIAGGTSVIDFGL